MVDLQILYIKSYKTFATFILPTHDYFRRKTPIIFNVCWKKVLMGKGLWLLANFNIYKTAVTESFTIDCYKLRYAYL